MRQCLTILTVCRFACLVVAPPWTLVSVQQPPVAGIALRSAWTLDGPWTDVAVDAASGAIYGLGESGRVVELDASGGVRRELRLPDSDGDELRLARLPDPAFLTFSLWTSDLRAYDRNGQPLWSYPRATGIDNVWTGDLISSNQADEVIVGYNGRTGMHLLAGTGQLVWESTSVAAVSHMSVGDVLGDGTPHVVATAAGGLLHVFASDGTRRLVLDPGFYAQMVRVSPPGSAAAGTIPSIFVAGTSRDPAAARSWTLASLGALSRGGAKIWRLEVPDDSIYAVSAASSVPLLAFSTRSGQIVVVNAATGSQIARAEAQGPVNLAWASTDGRPMLLVATGTRLIAFHAPDRID